MEAILNSLFFKKMLAYYLNLLTNMVFYVKMFRVFLKRGEKIMGDEPCYCMKIYNLISSFDPLFII